MLKVVLMGISLTFRYTTIGVVILVTLIAGLLVIAERRERAESDLADSLPMVAGIDVSSGGYLVLLDPDEAARRADVIVEVTVLKPGIPFWNTTDKTRPVGTAREVLDQDARIFTPANLRVINSFKGDVHSGQVISINRYGGQVGQDRFVVDEPYFIEGDRVIVFLRDCSTERSTLRIDQGFGYRFIQRFVVDSNGVTSKMLNRDPVELSELLKTVESEKDNPPLSPTDC